MCGISFTLTKIQDVAHALGHRGPDANKMFMDRNERFIMRFDRLNVNDLSSNGDQPMFHNDLILICNGEIFNHKSIEAAFNFEMKSDSDCEVILHLYHFLSQNTKETVGKTSVPNRIDHIMHLLCNHLDGEFAFCLVDQSNDLVVYARDPYGVRPLFVNTSSGGAASELKAFEQYAHEHVRQFPPGHFAVMRNFSEFSEFTEYIPTAPPSSLAECTTRPGILKSIRFFMESAVKKRLMSDRPICALLSGGLDSSLVAALVAKSLSYPLKTFSIGFEGSPDLKYARLVADHIGSEHTELVATPKMFLDAIEPVIRCIESYDTTTVRASIGNYLVAKHIKDTCNSVVVFNGDYADEVCGGYRYMQLCDDPEEFGRECRRLVNEIHYFDSLRSDRTISAHGLEARVPFADKKFVAFYQNIPSMFRMSNTQIEKLLLREAFDQENLLPKEVLWRKKEAFSDGVSKASFSWGDILKGYIDSIVSDAEFESMNVKKFKLKETYYYHKLFSRYYFNDDIIPHLWMPKYCDANVTDPSARKL